MRPVVSELAALGRLPTALDTPQADLDRWVRLLDEARLQAPTADEIPSLLGLFPVGDDTAFGLAWTVLHAVEACPDWPIWDALDVCDSAYADILRLRLRNAGTTRPAR
jgi:hypothetical protein